MRARRFLVSWFSFLVIGALLMMNVSAVAAPPDGTPGGGGGSGGSILVEGLTGVRSVAADGDQFVALHGDGSVSTWRMAINEKGPPYTGKPIKQSAHRMMGVTAGGGFIFSLATDGTVWSSQQDAPEQPAVQVAGLKDIKAISAAPDYLYALSADGRVSYHAINTKGTGTAGRVVSFPVRWMAPGRNGVMLGMGDGSVQYIAIDDKGEQGRPIILKALKGSAGASFPKRSLDCGQFLYAMLPGGSIVSAAVSGITAGEINRDGMLDIRGAIGVSAGCNHGVALRSDGTVWQLGFAIKENGIKAPTTPTQVADVRNAVAVAAGRDFDAAVMADGSVRFWSPLTVARQLPGVANVKKVVAGIGHTIVVKADGTIAEIAVDESGVQRAIPIPGIEGAVDCVVAGKTLLVLTADGTVQQVMFNPREYTVQKVDKLSGVTALSSGGSYVLALLDNGTLAHIAIDESGVHLTDPWIDLQNVASVAAGPDTFLALTVDGKGWGGTVKGRAVTTIPPSSITSAREAGSGLATGRRQHAALMGDGSVRIVDINEKGEATAHVWGDSHVAQIDGFAAVSLGTTQMALLKGDGTVWICPVTISEAGVQIADTATPLSGVRLAVAVAVGDTYAYALTAEGTVWFWARPRFG